MSETFKNLQNEVLKIKSCLLLDYEVKSYGELQNYNICQRHGHVYAITNLTEYTNLINNLYEHVIGKKISKKKFEDILIQSLFEYIDKKSSSIDILQIVEKLEIQDFHILLPLYNIKLDTNVLDFGMSKIVKYQYVYNYFESLGIEIPDFFKKHERDTEFNDICFIDIIIKAKDDAYAFEEAKNVQALIANTINFLFFKRNRTLTVNTTHRIFGDEIYFVGAKKYLSKSTSLGNTDEPLNLNSYEDYLSDKDSGIIKILNLITKISPESEIEKRLIFALNWTGMAIAEKNNSIALTQAIFAIEALLQYEAKEEPIEKSTVALISENIAFLLGNSLDERKRLEKDFKTLYRRRSKVAHGKGMDITSSDTENAIAISKALIFYFLTNPQIKEAKTMEKITNHIKKLKYSVPGDVQDTSK